MLRRYLADGTYRRLNASQVVANPDQRIAEDVRAFKVTTLSLALMALNSAFTIVAFSGVLWTINPLLFGVAVIYAGRSLLIFVLRHPADQSDYDQLDQEVSFRSGLIMCGTTPTRSRSRTKRRHRWLSCLPARRSRRQFSHDHLDQPQCGVLHHRLQLDDPDHPGADHRAGLHRKVIEFGVITQSAMAFATLVGAFSLIVTQFQSLSSYAAVVARLSALVEAVEQSGDPRWEPGRGSVNRPAECAPQLDVLAAAGSARTFRSGRPPRLPCRSER